MLTQETIAKYASYTFAILIFVLIVYLFFTEIWFVYLLASLNIFSFTFLSIFYIRQRSKKKCDCEEDENQ